MAAAKTIAPKAALAEAERVRQAEHSARNIALAARLADPKAVPVQAAPAPTSTPPLAAAKPRARFIDCGWFNCPEHLIDLEEIGTDPAEILRYATVHGRVHAKRPSGEDAFFCNVVHRDKELGKPDPKKKAPPPPALRSPSRIDAPGGVQRCARPACPARSNLDPDPKLRAKAIAKLDIEGWKETELGIFCCRGCANQAASDAASGFGTRAEIAKHPERGSFAAR